MRVGYTCRVGALVVTVAVLAVLPAAVVVAAPTGDHGSQRSSSGFGIWEGWWQQVSALWGNGVGSIDPEGLSASSPVDPGTAGTAGESGDGDAGADIDPDG